MSAIKAINAALVKDGFTSVYDAICIPGNIARAGDWAALAYASAEVNDHAPESSHPTEYPATVRPGKVA